MGQERGAVLTPAHVTAAHELHGRWFRAFRPGRGAQEKTTHAKPHLKAALGVSANYRLEKLFPPFCGSFPLHKIKQHLFSIS